MDGFLGMQCRGAAIVSKGIEERNSVGQTDSDFTYVVLSVQTEWLSVYQFTYLGRVNSVIRGNVMYDLESRFESSVCYDVLTSIRSTYVRHVHSIVRPFLIF